MGRRGYSSTRRSSRSPSRRSPCPRRSLSKPAPKPVQNTTPAPIAQSAAPPVQAAPAPVQRSGGFLRDYLGLTAALTTSRVASEMILGSVMGRGDSEIVEDQAPIEVNASQRADDNLATRPAQNMDGACASELSQYLECTTRYANDPGFCQNFLESLNACRTRPRM